jgi:nitroreductase
MEVYEAIKSRLTIREFKQNSVPKEIINEILLAGLWSPSSRNRQPWHFVVIDDKSVLREISAFSKYGPFLSDAPIAIAIIMDNSLADRPYLDAGRALQQMELLAWSKGLGTCFVSFHEQKDNERAKVMLEIPSNMELITIMPFGYRLDKVQGVKRNRKNLDEISHSNVFGTSFN